MAIATPTTTQPGTRPATQPTDAGGGGPQFTLVSLTLADARVLALRHNLDLAVSRLEPTIAAADLNAEQAAFEASFVVDANYSQLDSPVVNQTIIDPDAGGEPAVFRVLGGESEGLSINPALVQPLRTGGELRVEFPFDRFETDTGRVLNPQFEQDARFSITQPLGQGFGSDVTEQGIRIAAARLGQALVRQKLDVIITLANVDRSYWQLYAARQAVDVRQQQVDLARQQMGRARRLFEAGQAAEVEVVRAESGLADAEDLLIQANANVGTEERQLKQLLNATPETNLHIEGGGAIIPLTAPIPVQYDLNREQLIEMALGRRMELLEAQLQQAEQQAVILAASNAYYQPRLDLRYEYGVNGLGGSYGDAVDVLGDREFADHSVGIQFEYPLGSRAERERLRSAMLRELQQLADVESRRLLVRREVLDAVADIETAWDRIVAAQRRVTAAQRLLEAEQRQFELGTRTTTEVLEAQSTLATARLSLIQALTDYETSRTNLAAATGTILGKTGVTLEVPGME